MLDTERLALYYSHMSHRYERRHFAVRFVVGASGTAGIVAFMNTLPEELRAICVAVVTVLTLLDLLGRSAEKATVLAIIKGESDDVKAQLEEMWIKIRSGLINDGEACLTLANLVSRMTRMTSRAKHIPIDKQLRVDCERDGYAAVRRRHEQT